MKGNESTIRRPTKSNSRFVGYHLIAYIALATVVINALEVAIVMVFSFNAVSTSAEKLFGMTKAQIHHYQLVSQIQGYLNAMLMQSESLQTLKCYLNHWENPRKNCHEVRS